MTPRLVFLALAACAGMIHAEIIDKIAISVGNQVITEEQVGEEVRVTQFLNQVPLDLSAVEKKKAAERLVEQTLIRREMDFSRYPLPQLNESGDLYDKVRSRYPSDAAFREDLSRYGITDDDLRRHVWWQLTTLRFIEYRFRPAVQIAERDLKEYYQQHLAEWQKNGAQPVPAYEESREKIQEILTSQHVDQALDKWLTDARTQVDIRYRKGALQ
jgi:hypothetical protein